MVLDVCPSSIADLSVVRSAVERTGRWAERGRAAFLDHPDAARRQCQFGIVQGGTDEALREQSARQVTEIGFDGYAVGGLSVGEDRSEMLSASMRAWISSRSISPDISWVWATPSASSSRSPGVSTC